MLYELVSEQFWIARMSLLQHINPLLLSIVASMSHRCQKSVVLEYYCNNCQHV